MIPIASSDLLIKPLLANSSLSAYVRTKELVQNGRINSIMSSGCQRVLALAISQAKG